VEAYVFTDITTDDFLASFANDDYAQIEIAYYY